MCIWPQGTYLNEILVIAKASAQPYDNFDLNVNLILWMVLENYRVWIHEDKYGNIEKVGIYNLEATPTCILYSGRPPGVI